MSNNPWDVSYLRDAPKMPRDVAVYEEANVLCIQVRHEVSEQTLQRGVNFLLRLIDQKQNSPTNPG